LTVMSMYGVLLCLTIISDTWLKYFLSYAVWN
jgi:hypothetical protein